MKVYTEYNADTDLYDLIVSVPGMGPTPAGPRIFRAPPHPDVRFSHPSQEDAEADADKIREYWANLPAKKISNKEMQQRQA